MSGKETKYASLANRGQRLRRGTISTILTNPANNWAEMLFGTTSGTSPGNVLFVIVTTAGNLMPLLSTLKRNMDTESCKSLKDYFALVRSGRYPKY